MEDRFNIYLIILTVILFLAVLAQVAGNSIYSDSVKDEALYEVRGVEEGQGTGSSGSNYFRVELVNGSSYHYWWGDYRQDPGYAEIESSLDLFNQRQNYSEGLDYLSDNEVCARDITSRNIQIVEC